MNPVISALNSNNPNGCQSKPVEVPKSMADICSDPTGLEYGAPPPPQHVNPLNTVTLIGVTAAAASAAPSTTIAHTTVTRPATLHTPSAGPVDAGNVPRVACRSAGP